MKKLIHYILFLMLSFIAQKGTAQCSPSFEYTPIDACCFTVKVTFDPGCAGITFQELYLNPNVDPQNSGVLTAATQTVSGIYGAVDQTNNVAMFSPVLSNNNIMDLAQIGQPQEIGKICLAAENSSVFLFADLTDDMGTAYMGQNYLPLGPGCLVPLSKMYGDTSSNQPTRIKAFGDGIYVSGTRDIHGDLYGTISKFDPNTGNLIWDFQAQMPSVFQDFDFDVADQKLYIVGRTEPFNNNIDNESLLYIVEASNGSLTLGKRYAQHGREHFQNIIMHPNPANSNYPIYIVGTRNPSNNYPSGEDVPVVFNINLTGDVNWVRSYFEPASTTEYESHRGLFPVGEDLVMVGNDMPDNNGILVKIDGVSGDVLAASKAYDALDFHDGRELIYSPAGDNIVVAGTDFANQEAIMLLVDVSNFQYVYGLRFPDISSFTELMLDQNGYIYAIGPSKANPNNTIVSRVFNSGFSLQQDYSNYLDNGETDFSNGRFYIDETQSKMYFSDARKSINPILGMGNFDILISSFNLLMDGDCVLDFGQETEVYEVPIDIFAMESEEWPEPPHVFDYDLNPIDYLCDEFCGLSDCFADFLWETDCPDLEFFAYSTGVPPITWEWDIFCDNNTPPDGTNQTLLISGHCGTFDVCLKATDANGCVYEVEHEITVSDNQPPFLPCPGDLIYPTDQGECHAIISIPLNPTDNCDNSPTLSGTLSGATTGSFYGSLSNSLFNLGTTQVTCVAVDACGNVSPPCTFTVTIEDLEPPLIYCPSLLTPITVPLCDEGIIVNYSPPITGDNCGVDTVICNPPPGSFFTCGTTIVTCIAIDLSGNADTCSFPVEIICECAEVVSDSISCGQMDNTYQFSIIANNVGGGSGNLAFMSSPTPGITLTNTAITYIGGNQYEFSGIIHYSPPPVPGSVTIDITWAYQCYPGGYGIPCPLSVTLTRPCCEDVSIADMEVCEDAGSLIIPLTGNLTDVIRVIWEISYDCFTWTSIQDTPNYQDLEIYPNQYTKDICIRAIVERGPGAGACTNLTTQPATITLCKSINFSIADQAYCYTGNQITPAPLVATIIQATTNCNYTVQWYNDDDGTPLSNATGLNYQPLPLTLTDVDSCYQDFRYRVEITSECGVSSSTAKIRLHNNDAPAGDIVMSPLEPTPFCPKEDAELWFDPGCLDEDNPIWEWLIGTNSSGYTTIQNGTSSPKFNTNQLTQDTIIAVTSTNGTCQEDTVFFPIEVYEETAIKSFSVLPYPSCAPTEVTMHVKFSPAGINCGHTIEWYRNTTLIHTSYTSSSPVQYTYPGPVIEGNYYVKIYNNCCPDAVIKSTVITLAPPVIPVIVGPCYLCPGQVALLEGILFNLPAGTNCSFKWYRDSVEIPQETNPDIIIKYPGEYYFVATCDSGCDYSASFSLGMGCTGNDMRQVENAASSKADLLKVYPNPNSGTFNVALQNPDQESALVKLLDSQGRVIWEQGFNRGKMSEAWEREFNLPPGKVYFLWAQIGTDIHVEKIAVIRL